MTKGIKFNGYLMIYRETPHEIHMFKMTAIQTQKYEFQFLFFQIIFKFFKFYMDMSNFNILFFLIYFCCISEKG